MGGKQGNNLVEKLEEVSLLPGNQTRIGGNSPYGKVSADIRNVARIG